MMKKITALAAAFLAGITILSFGAFGASAAGDNTAAGFDGDTSNCGVYDDKGLFTDDEIDELDDLVAETSEELELYIAIYLSDTAYSESRTESFSDEAYEELFGADSDGVFYYMDLSEQYSAYDYISTSGKAILLYDDNLDAMYNEIFASLPASGEAITADEISGGIKKICRTLESYNRDLDSGDYKYIEYNDTYVYYKNGETVVSTSKPTSMVMKNALMIGIPAGLIIGLLFYFITRSHYKFKKSLSPSAYVSHEKSRFIQRDDIFIRTYTTKMRINNDSPHSGGGSHGGGFHGGGGSHGDGSGHR